MRKTLSLVSALVLIALIISILRSTPQITIDTPQVSLVASGDVDDTTDTSGAPSELSPTTIAPVTDTTATPTPEGSSLRAEFVLTEVVFGDNGYVVVTNVGGAAGDLEGYAICQKPGYFVFPAIEVEPFEVVWVAVGNGVGLTSTAAVEVIPANGAVGRLARGDGELALYRSAQFSLAEELLSYVEWGEAGHGRSSVAVEAGLWEEGAFIEIPDDAFGVVSAAAEPSSPSDWVAGLGG